MNTRILELIENPDLLQSADLKLLNDQIRTTPYVQSLRALALLATSRYDPENYQQELSTTAAYTTDKKILYQLVNGVSKPSAEVNEPVLSQEIDNQDGTGSENEVQEHLQVQKNINIPESGAYESGPETTVDLEKAALSPVLESKKETFTKIAPSETEGAKPVYVNGELNRILFEGEEDFLEKEAPVIDKEASAESGQLVIADPNISPPKVFSEESAPVNELAAKEEEITGPETKEEESEEVEIKSAEEPIAVAVAGQEEPPTADVSFHGIAPFLPGVKITAAPKKEETVIIPAPVSNKHEEEMQRLIAEVEKKIKEKKASQIENEPVEEQTESTEISFSDTQDFVVKAETPANESTEAVQEEITASEAEAEASATVNLPGTDAVGSNPVSEPNAEMPVRSGWKPMSVPLQIPDALLKTERKSLNVKPEVSPIKTEQEVETAQEETVPVEPPTEVTKVSADEEAETTQVMADDDSNVPQFINTWQSWLKIDRKETTPEIQPEPEEDRKTVIIEKFIETAPRISQLREEGSFVIKEKKSDISHLMTETLANIYVEQKLYARAIHAFHILAEKHPQKAEYFRAKVKEVRDLRNNFQ